MISTYRDKYRNWFKEHWVKNEWIVTDDDTPTKSNYYHSPSALAGEIYQSLQQWPSHNPHKNEEGMQSILKRLEQESLNYKDEMNKHKKRADEMEEKLTFLQNTLLFQSNKIKQKNQVIKEMTAALKKYSGKCNVMQQKQPMLERKLKEFEAKKQNWDREKSTMANEINHIASKQMYRRERVDGDLEQQEAVVSLLENNSKLLDQNYDACRKAWYQNNSCKSTEDRLMQLKREKSKIKGVLDAKRAELLTLKHIKNQKKSVQFEDDDDEKEAASPSSSIQFSSSI